MSGIPDNTPDNRVNSVLTGRASKPSQEEMIELTRDFVAANGANQQLRSAIDAITDYYAECAHTSEFKAYLKEVDKIQSAAKDIKDIQTRMSYIRESMAGLKQVDTKFLTKSPYPDLTLDDAHNLLFGHNGIHGEYGSGLGTTDGFLRDITEREFDRRIEIVAGLIAGESDCRKNKSKIFDLDALGIPKENRIEALYRCERHIRQWVDANRDVFTPAQVQKFDQLLYDFTSKLEPVKNYMDKVFAYTGVGQTIAYVTPSPFQDK